MFTSSLSASATSVSLHILTTGEQPREVTWPVPPPKYRPLLASEDDVASSVQYWAMNCYTFGCRFWWVVGDVVMLFHPRCPPDKVVKYANNSWDRWSSYCQEVAPAELSMRKGLDRSGRERHWHRCLPEHTLSTTGLLCVLVNQILLCRSPDPIFPEHTLKTFLSNALANANSEILLPLDPGLANAYCSAATKIPASLCSELPTERGEFWIRPWLDNSEGNTHTHLSKLFQELYAAGKCDNQKVSASVLLLELSRHSSLTWLGKALLHQLARLIEASPNDDTDNPVEGERIWGGRADLDLCLHLSMGRGGAVQ